MLGKTENIERLISLNDQYINKLRELLSNYKSRKNRKMNLLFQLAMFTTIVSLLITSYFAYSVDSTNVFIFRTYILIQTVLIVSCVGFAFRFAYNYAESTASVFQERNDIRIIAKHLYQISKRTSQLKEHTLKGDDYSTQLFLVADSQGLTFGCIG